MKETNKKKRVGRPSLLVAWGLAMILTPWYRIRYGVRVDKAALRGMRGPAMVLCPHICGKDHFLVLLALWRTRPNYVASAHLTSRPILGWVLRRLHIIPKKMFCTDMRTIRDIMRAKNEGNTVVLFPEGRLSACGHSLPVAEGTAELVKRLNIDVYTVTANGGYLTFPKWGLKRRGKIHVTAEKLFSAGELETLPLAEVKAAIDGAIRHDDELAMQGVRYRTKDTTAGLDGILRLCPRCGGYGSLVTGGGHIRCTCGLDATLGEDWVLRDAPFARINEWFDHQQSKMDPETLVLEDEVRVGTTDEDGILRQGAGHGSIRLDNTSFTFHGQVFDKEVSFSIPTDAIAGLPVTPGDHFDLFHAGQMYLFSPVADPRASIDYVMFIDRRNMLAGERE